MEVEFETDAGRATNKMVYLQLKSGDSHLRRRKRDDERVMQISERHAEYWADAQFPVILVVRDADGAIEWMEIREPLREQRAAGDWPARQIAFRGARLDVMAVRGWRRAALGDAP